MTNTTAELTSAASNWALQRFIDRGHPRSAEFKKILDARTSNPVTDGLVHATLAVLGAHVPDLERVDPELVRAALPAFIEQLRKTSAVSR